MENCRKSVFLIFFAIILMAFSVSVSAQTADESQPEVKKEETVQPPEVAEAPSASSASALLEPQPVAMEPVTAPAEITTPAVQAVPQEPAAPIVAPEPVTAPAEITTPAVQAVPQEPAAPVVATEPVTAPAEIPTPAVQAVPQEPAAPVVAPEPVTAPAEIPTPAVQAVAQPAPVAQPAAPVAEKAVSTPPNPSGVLEISGYKYPVYLYVPKDYKTDRTYSLIMVAPAESIKAQEQIDYLTGLAQRRSVFILCPHVLWPKPGDTPIELDKWLLDVKKDVVQRFPINKHRIYLIGKNSGAHYAAYLATQHPGEFSAAALFGEAWNGPFQQMIVPSSDPVKQIPFYIALKTGSDAKARNQAWLDKLQKKGYVLYLTEYPKDETLEELEFKKSAYEWLEEASQNWIAEVDRRHQGWKGQLKKGVRDFFTV